MESIRNLYRIGFGPSSSHTMGPGFAAAEFKNIYPGAFRYEAVLMGSLAATGIGHMTDKAVMKALMPKEVHIIWEPDIIHPEHPNALTLRAIDSSGKVAGEQTWLSVGGGSIRKAGEKSEEIQLYSQSTFQEFITQCSNQGFPLSEFVLQREEPGIENFLWQIWKAMEESVTLGLKRRGVLPGGLFLAKKSYNIHQKALRQTKVFRRTGVVSAYALAVSEENASLGRVVTAPTCGACGILPAVLYYLRDLLHLDDADIIRGLATAGLVGTTIKANATISGAEGGCQAEVGSACAMAAAAATELMGGTVFQVENAAEMGLEHHLGLTCDPVKGLVQIPCIERNAAAATRALDCADYALLGDGTHHISFDQVVDTMARTGRDMLDKYKETSKGGLASIMGLGS